MWHCSGPRSPSPLLGLPCSSGSSGSLRQGFAEHSITPSAAGSCVVGPPTFCCFAFQGVVSCFPGSSSRDGQGAPHSHCFQAGGFGARWPVVALAHSRANCLSGGSSYILGHAYRVQESYTHGREVAAACACQPPLPTGAAPGRGGAGLLGCPPVLLAGWAVGGAFVGAVPWGAASPGQPRGFLFSMGPVSPVCAKGAHLFSVADSGRYCIRGTMRLAAVPSLSLSACQ